MFGLNAHLELFSQYSSTSTLIMQLLSKFWYCMLKQ